ncbi:branched-chain amino acid ABC transporter substrate-binding protein [Piscinibacter sakaiensis]|uniref:branched-chain amino acid ABC transporter substrate-binding protein n=1 Tax=Piscinibacter sakaiensis TaxID=1547922 RepID=UPI003AADBC8A
MTVRPIIVFAFSCLFSAKTSLASPRPPAEPITIAMVESLSGAFANTGEAVYRNLVWAVERVNNRGGVVLPPSAGGNRMLALRRYDSKGQNEQVVSALRSAIDDGAQFIVQGNSSANAAALTDAVSKHNERGAGPKVLHLNYSAVEPALTNEKCSFWHFRFDAHADMRIAALMNLMRADAKLKRVYLFGQDYSFGQAVLRETRRQLVIQRPDIAIVGDELHPMGRVKDFMPYVAKIKASGAQAVVTGNWGSDLTLLVKAAREAGFDGYFYTFYGNALGAPAAMGDAGIGKVFAVADWMPNLQTNESDAFYKSFRARFPDPADDYVHMRMQLMIESLVKAIERAGAAGKLSIDGKLDAVSVARALENVEVELSGQSGWMRASDHQFQQPLAVGELDRIGTAGVKFDVEGSGYGFRVVKRISAGDAELPTTCRMHRPEM